MTTSESGHPRSRRGERSWGPLYAAPAVLLVLAFLGYPLVSLGVHAFTRWDGFSPEQWVGLKNFGDMLSDSQFKAALINNVFFALAVPILLVGPLILAYLIHRRIPGWRIYRWTYFLPAVFSIVVVGILAKFIITYDGPLNALFRSVGLGGLSIDWLADASTALPAILVVVVWTQFGYNVVLYLAAMSGIDPNLPEAARIDGGDDWQVLRHVYVPGLRRVMEIILVTNMILAFAFMFPYVYTITNGGPGFQTYVAEFYIYNTAFTFHHLGYASALGLALTGLVVVLGFFQIRILTRGSEA
jgi:ABC-type sugar transport system permease subunit